MVCFTSLFPFSIYLSKSPHCSNVGTICALEGIQLLVIRMIESVGRSVEGVHSITFTTVPCFTTALMVLFVHQVAGCQEFTVRVFTLLLMLYFPQPCYVIVTSSVTFQGELVRGLRIPPYTIFRCLKC